MVKVCLTIDDGPSSDFLRKVKFLDSMGIPAVFFCRGDFLERRAKAAILAVKKGLIIGNHSYDHPHFSELDIDQAIEQILRTDRIMERIYEKAGVERRAKLFRFPYGDRGSGREVDESWPELAKPREGRRSRELMKFLKSLGYVEVPWTFETLEWSIFKGYHGHSVRDIGGVFSRIDGLFGRSRKEVVLIHDHPETKEFFPLIIEKFLEHGAEFEPLGRIQFSVLG